MAAIASIDGTQKVIAIVTEALVGSPVYGATVTQIVRGGPAGSLGVTGEKMALFWAGRAKIV
jgi:hypothetical protein